MRQPPGYHEPNSTDKADEDSDQESQMIKSRIAGHVEITDLDELHCLLGIEIKRDRDKRTTHLSQLILYIVGTTSTISTPSPFLR
jgi:hypothetical protein